MDEKIPLHHDYPRPHLRRNLWFNLNGNWSFTITKKTSPYPMNFDYTIRVPFPVESYLSGIEKSVDETMYLWYKRKFRLKSPDWYKRAHHQARLLLNFDKVDYETVVYVNRHIVGRKHLGGYDPFSYDITPYFIDYDMNEIVVRVWDPTNKGFQPRGKQLLDGEDKYWIFYTPCSGIWSTVWLEQVPTIYIHRLQFNTQLSSTDVLLKYRIELAISSSLADDHQSPNKEFPIYRESNFHEDTLLLDVRRDEIIRKKYNVYDALDIQFKITITQKNSERLIEFESYRANVDEEISFPLSKIHLWSPENPYLYDVQIDLYHVNKLIDHIDSYLGFRQVSLCLNKKKICLNGKPYIMLGVLDQGYWPDGLYRSPTDYAYQYDIKQMKNLGFNTIRKHMKSEPSRWYYWCDVFGMLVWQDMPSADNFNGYEIELDADRQLRLHRDNITNNLPTRTTAQQDIMKTRPWGYEKAFHSKLQFETELKAMIDFLSFHPSIVIWVLFNEEWGQYDSIRLGTWLQRYDQNRLIDAASGWQDRTGIGHLRDIHDYTNNILFPTYDDGNRALVIGECGGFGLLNNGSSYNRYPDQYFMTYVFEQYILNLSSNLSAMIYTQLSDVEGEMNGIFTYDRQEIKFITTHVQRVLKKDFSRLYKLRHIWNLTSIPYTNYTNLSFSNSFNLTLPNNSHDNLRFYLYTCYLYSQVNLTFNSNYTMILNETHEIKDYHYLSLPSNLFDRSTDRQHFLDIQIRYLPSSDDENKSFVYTNRTYFYLNLAILFE